MLQRLAATDAPAVRFVEPLEERRLLAGVSLNDGILQLGGSYGQRNTMTVTVSGSNYIAKVNSTSKTVSASSVKEIKIYGGDWNDTISISGSITKKSYIDGRAGNDSIYGGGGPDLIYGDTHNDTIKGNGGNDSIYGEAGNDYLDGGSGTNIVDGGSGTDTVKNNTAGSSTSTNSSLIITSLQLWDTSANKVVKTLTHGSTINLSTLPSNLTIVAQTSGSVKSVKFGYDSNSSYRVENASPWSISGDVNNKPVKWNIATGSHTFKATPYSSTGAKGTPGATKSITINFTKSSTASSPTSSGSTSTTSSISVSSLQLWDTSANKAVKTRATIDLATLPSNLTIVAQTSGSVKSVKFGYDSNSSYRVENAAPWSISGDVNNKPVKWNIATGSHTFKATPYTSTGAKGTPGATKSVTINFTKSSTTSNPPTTSNPTPVNGIVPRNNSASAPKAVITAVSSKTIHAGQSFHAHAMSSSLNGGTPLTARYVWDFGDSGSKYNVLQGFNVAHNYTKAGTYTVKLMLTNEAGKTATTSTTVTVQSAGRTRYYVSNTGSDSNDGKSETKPFKTFGKAVSKAGDNVEILFKGGQRFDTTKGFSTYGKNFLIGSYGSGRATIRYTGPRDYTSIIYLGGGSQNAGEATVRDLIFDSTLDTSNAAGLPQSVAVGGRGDAVINCEFRNVGYAVNAQAQPNGLLVQDSSAPLADGLRDYFVWASGKDLTIIGNYVKNVRSHVVRVADLDRINISHNDFSNPNESSGYRGTLTIHKGSYAYVGGNKLNKGWFSVGPLGDGDGVGDKSARWNWSVFENNVATDTRFIALHGAQHTMFRNNVLKEDAGWTLEIQGYNSTYNRGVVDITFANNTVINHAKTGNFLRVGSSVNGINLINNLYYAPNLVTGTTGAAPVFVYSGNLSSFNKITGNVWPSPTIEPYAEGGINYVWPNWSNSDGYRSPAEWEAFSQVIKDYYEDPSLNTSTYAPSTSSKSASAGVVWAGVFTDMKGKIRSNSGSWTAGAIEV